MLNLIRCIDQRSAFKNSGISCLAVILNLSNPRKTILHATKKFQVARYESYDESYTVYFRRSFRTHGSVVKAVCSELGDLGSILGGAETPCSPLAILCGTEPVSALTRARLYCCIFYNCSFLGFRQWRSRADRFVNLYTSIWLPLFWRTWTWARASNHPHVRGWHMGRYYSQVSGFVFSWFLETTEKTKASFKLVTFLRLTPLHRCL